MNRTIFSACLLVIISLLLLSSNRFFLWAEEETKKIITEVEIAGNKVISSQIILAKIRTKAGDKFDQLVLNEDIKRLYASGYFTDVKLELSPSEEGIKVMFVVVEKPKVTEIIIEGNKAIRSEALKKDMKTAVGQILDRKILKEDISQLRELYESKGLHLINIDDEVDESEVTGEATIYILIDEGEKVRIQRINIYGNLSFSDGKILRLLKTRGKGWFRAGFFKEDTFKEDLERVKVFYWQNGYADIEVTPDIHYDVDKRRMYITLNIAEGKKYLTGQIGIIGNKLFPTEEIREQLEMTTGKVFSEYSSRRDIGRIQEYYFARGYIFAEVSSDETLHRDTGVVDMIYKITEGELAYVDKIRIEGNLKTKDIVIRRELRIKPGDKFDGGKLQRSKEKLYNLGYFEEVTYDIEPGSSPQKKDLTISVKEKKTGEFSFGGGYSSVDQLVGFVQLSQGNFDLFNFPTFTGGGQALSIRGEFGQRRKRYELSFTEPWIFNQPVSFGFDAYDRIHTWENYNEGKQGGDIRLGKRFGEYDSVDLMYKAEKVRIYDVTTRQPEIFNERGSNLISSMTLSLTRDTRDNVYVPTKGILVSGRGEGAGGFLGGEKDFYTLSGLFATYFSYFEKLVLELKLRVATADNYDDTQTVPISERLFAGGANTIRGYGDRMVGPPDSGASPVGGKTMLVFNAECTFPIIEIIKGAVFYDVGNVWRDSYHVDFTELVSGVGVGVRVKTPIGPIKLDYGYGLNYRDWDVNKNGQFYFSMSRGF